LPNTKRSIGEPQAAKRHDRQLRAADAQRREPDDDADDRGDGRGEEHRQRERDAGAELRDRQPCDAGGRRSGTSEICPTMAR